MPRVLDAEHPAIPAAALESAARFVLRSGLATTVLVVRRPGVIPMARALANSRGLKVRIDINPTVTTVHFSRA